MCVNFIKMHLLRLIGRILLRFITRLIVAVQIRGILEDEKSATFENRLLKNKASLLYY